MLPPFIEEAVLSSGNERLTLLFSELISFSSLEPQEQQLKLSIEGEAGSYNFEWQIESQQFPAKTVSLSLTMMATLFGTESLVL